MTNVSVSRNVIDMSYMCYNAVMFNNPITVDTLNVRHMSGMFSGVSNFNQPLGVADDTTNVQSSLVTSNVTAMSSTFERATQLNPHLPFSFVTSSVLDIIFMYNGASNFNQPLLPTPGHYA